MELKSHDGGLSPAQLETLKAIEDAGATVAVVHGLLNAIQKLEEWQLLRGAT